ncbi:MAG TPA: hypothetical protein VMZ91_00080 [Candidatus Paceibacterota bacterium]|nr:hypothetical protein [Candidatus Paceibacterota bacterium]
MKLKTRIIGAIVFATIFLIILTIINYMMIWNDINQLRFNAIWFNSWLILLFVGINIFYGQKTYNERNKNSDKGE